MSLAEDVQHTRLLPNAVEAGLKRWLWRILGFTFTLGAVAGWMSLASWSIHDPSLNHATEEPAKNLLGYGGAVVADLLFQTLGLASIWVFLPLAAWGWHLMTLLVPNRKRERILMWPMSVVLLAGALSGINLPTQWPLPNGLGGIVGDYVLHGTQLLGTYINIQPNLLHILSALLLPAMGLWGLSAACALTFSDFAVLVKPNETDETAPEDQHDHLSTTIEETSLQEVLRASHAVDEALEHEPFEQSGFATGEQLQPDTGPQSSVTVNVIGSVVDSGGRIEPYMEESGDTGVQGTNGRTQSQSGSAASDFESVDISPNPQTSVRVNTKDKVTMDVGPILKTRAKPTQSQKKSKKKTKVIREKQLPLLALPGTFSLPPLDLLTPSPLQGRATELSEAELWENARHLEQVLEDFGVKGEIINVRPGPVVTLYELEPARGVKSARVIGLADDIARSMSAVSARVAVIPGRNAIGIELPNQKRQIVYLRELLETPEHENASARLPLVLGKNIGGGPVVVDLARMPHLLIAGTTGSGKSVGINTMILSLLYRMPPDKCKFIMIDPKMLELSAYDGIPHMLAPVVTDPKKAIVALKWTVRKWRNAIRKCPSWACATLTVSMLVCSKLRRVAN